ncbi:MAG: KEOPS complex N(6)-L-threonylcarbamoyladenine synthase Kae1 [Candidatus Micrarchaeaceae archaeon]
MAIMGIESSAHTFGVGIVENGKVLANVKSMYKIGNKGMIPIEVSEHHIENAGETIKLALEKAKIKSDELEGVGYTKGPGMGPCLQVGQLSAKTLSYRLKIPIVSINHGVAHVEITKHIQKMKDPLALYVSGGNSQLLVLNQNTRKYRVLGETFDIGLGNAIDNLARSLGLEHAWGSDVERLAKEGSYIEMPYTVKGMDFSFTGLLTHAIKKLKTERNEDVCYSFQETAFSMLCEATERALLLSNKNELCLCGGVAQNTKLSTMLEIMASEHGVRFAKAPDEFNADNGAMIAVVAEKNIKNKAFEKLEDCDIKQRYRIDEVIVYE